MRPVRTRVVGLNGAARAQRTLQAQVELVHRGIFLVRLPRIERGTRQRLAELRVGLIDIQVVPHRQQDSVRIRVS